MGPKSSRAPWRRETEGGLSESLEWLNQLQFALLHKEWRALRDALSNATNDDGRDFCDRYERFQAYQRYPHQGISKLSFAHADCCTTSDMAHLDQTRESVVARIHSFLETPADATLRSLVFTHRALGDEAIGDHLPGAALFFALQHAIEALVKLSRQNRSISTWRYKHKDNDAFGDSPPGYFFESSFGRKRPSGKWKR